VVEAFTGTRGEHQRALLKQYWIDDGQEEDDYIAQAETLVYPIGMGPMQRKHKQYLMNRQFSPNKLEKEWGLQGTDHKDPGYKFRVIAPIDFKYAPVSYQGRDITDRQSEKYKACSREKEVIHHKHVLYGWDKAKWDACLVVEGITGVWRFGPGTVGTFGAQYKRSQVRLLASRYKRAFLCFDNDEAGVIAQDSMDVELTVLGVETIIVDLDEDEDSGSIDQADADAFMREVRT
jgi:DNA primase